VLMLNTDKTPKFMIRDVQICKLCRGCVGTEEENFLRCAYFEHLRRRTWQRLIPRPLQVSACLCLFKYVNIGAVIRDVTFIQKLGVPTFFPSPPFPFSPSPYPSLHFPSLSSLPFPLSSPSLVFRPIPSLPLEVGPLNPARGSGEAL